ncbi:hypothetical protein LMH73_018355 [Vibrio splendidus]|nr:hypothetical protein [Vibrio splendidus]MCC4880727.1 hypothetical protein [Vibrio splendidus]
MKVVVKKEVITVENAHDLIRRSFLRFLSNKKPSIFTYFDSEITETECDGTMHVKFDNAKYKVKDIKPMVSELKSLWKDSSYYQRTGFAKSQLLQRGWTQSAIKKFLGQCDCEVANPHYRSGSPMQLFHVLRVISMENSEAWQEWYESSLVKRRKLSVASHERASNARDALFKQVHSITISFPSLTKKQLYQNAVNHYNDLASIRDKEFISLSTSNDDFLHRICVNYLRHRYNDYEARLERMSGSIGCNDAYYILKSRILKTISDCFSYLKEAVDQQLERLQMQ